MTTATAPRTTTLLLLPPLVVLTSALLTPMQTATLQCRPCIVPNHPSWQPHPHPQRHQTRQTSSHIKTTTSLHQQKQLLQPQKGGIVVESPPNGVIVRDILVDMILGPRDDNNHGSDGREDDDFLLGGGTAAFSSSRSRATSPPPTMRMQPSSPPPSSSQDKTLPLFPNLKTSNTVHGGPRRISPGESAVFERAITAKSNPRSHANGKRGLGVNTSGASSWNTPMDDIRRQPQPGGVSIRGDSSMLRSTGFVGGSSTAGGGSTRFFSSNTSGAGGGGGATSFRGSSGVSLNNGNGYNSVGGGSSRNNVGKNNNNNQSFRNGTGRDYSSSAGTKFGSIGRSNSGGGKNNVDVPLGGASRSGVSIKGDSSMFSSTGFMNGGDVVRNSGGGGGYGGGYGASPPVGNRRASVTSTAYNSQHYFDAPAKSSAYPDTTPSYNTNEGQSISTGGYDIHSYSSTATPPDTPSYYNLEQQPSFSAESRNVHTTPSPTTKKYTSGQSLGDNFLSASHSVKRSHDPDDDDEFDEDMLGYESPTRRGEGFLTAPDPSYADQPIHYGKWMSELYAEQGLDVLSGGMEGFGAIMGEMRKGGDFGGRSAAAPAGGGGYGNGSSMGYGGDAGYGNGNNNGYGGDVGYGSSNSNGYGMSNGYGSDGGYGKSNNSYGSNSGYGSSNSNNGYRTGGDVSFSGFRGTPPQGY